MGGLRTDQKEGSNYLFVELIALNFSLWALRSVLNWVQFESLERAGSGKGKLGRMDTCSTLWICCASCRFIFSESSFLGCFGFGMAFRPLCWLAGVGSIRCFGGVDWFAGVAGAARLFPFAGAHSLSIDVSAIETVDSNYDDDGDGACRCMHKANKMQSFLNIYGVVICTRNTTVVTEESIKRWRLNNFLVLLYIQFSILKIVPSCNQLGFTAGSKVADQRGKKKLADKVVDSAGYLGFTTVSVKDDATLIITKN